ncbi:MAG: hypothetical protein VXW29_18630, partial [SAR324 cluster bacterium]|nr:hypothetical protein [SAR324 cluster bacterium]
MVAIAGKFVFKQKQILGWSFNVIVCAAEDSLGAMAVFVIFDDSANVRFSGETFEYVAKGESGLPIRHYFCSVCGAMIHVEADAYDTG